MTTTHHLFTSIDPLVRMSEVPDRLTLVSLLERPGLLRFLTLLEWSYFSPKTKANEDFEIVLATWPDDAPIRWAVAILPLLKLPETRRIAAETGMRIADGVPTKIDHGGVRRFPVDHARVFTIENDLGSPVYFSNGPDFIRDEERRWLREFKRTHP